MANGYSSYRGRGSSGKVVLVVLLVVLLAVAGIFAYSALYGDRPPNDDMVTQTPSSDATETPPAVTESPKLIIEQSTPPVEPSPEVVDVLTERPDTVRAVMLPEGGSAAARAGALTLAREGRINAVVVELKNHEGRLWFASDSDTAIGAAAVVEDIDTDALAAFIDALHDEGVYVIAQMSVFEENLVSNAFRDMSVATQNKSRWLDWRYHGWLNPYSDDVLRYIKDLCGEVAELGVDEVLLDSLRFPTRGRPELLYFADEVELGVSRTDRLLAFAEEVALSLGEVRLNIQCQQGDLVEPFYASGVSADMLRVADYLTVDGGAAMPINGALLRLDTADGRVSDELVSGADGFGGFVVQSGDGVYVWALP